MRNYILTLHTLRDDGYSGKHHLYYGTLREALHTLHDVNSFRALIKLPPVRAYIRSEPA